jgi:molybdopterin molybdotransferase
VHIDRFQENRFIRLRGSEAKTGDVVLPAGTVLGPAEIAILAQVGAVRPRVVRRPVVRHLATGNELVSPDQSPGPGQIRDTNSSLLAALLKGQGVALTDSTRVADDPSSLTKIADGNWDLLLVSGGASVGDYDFGAETLRRLGFTIHFDRINLRPGKPLTFATRGNQAAFVIPGNPVSHFVCYHVAIRLAVELLAGLPESWDLPSLPINGGEPVKPDPRDTFWPARVSVRDGRLVVAPVRWSTSGDTFSLAGTNALARVNANSPANGSIQTLLLHPL